MARPPVNENGLITMEAFSKLAGCDKNAVERAVKLGHLGDAVSRNANGHIRIDPKLAQRNWAHNWADTAKTPPKLREFLSSALPQNPSSTQRPAVRAKEIDWANLPVSGSRQILAAAKAQTEQINLETKLGNLVHIDDVRAAQFEACAIFRRAIETLPAQVGPVLGLTHDQTVWLEKEIGKRLSSLADLDGIDFVVKKRTPA